VHAKRANVTVAKPITFFRDEQFIHDSTDRLICNRTMPRQMLLYRRQKRLAIELRASGYVFFDCAVQGDIEWTKKRKCFHISVAIRIGKLKHAEPIIEDCASNFVRALLCVGEIAKIFALANARAIVSEGKKIVAVRFTLVNFYLRIPGLYDDWFTLRGGMFLFMTIHDTRGA
jgi:hypothetical protein